MPSRISQILSTLGTGGGTTNQNVNGSVTPVRFKFIPTLAKAPAEIHRLVFYCEGAGSILAANYGPIAGLTNGILLGRYKQTGDVLVEDLLGGLTGKSTGLLEAAGFNMELRDFSAGNDYIRGEILFTVTAGVPLVVYGDEYLAMIVRDDLTTLTLQYGLAYGQYLGQ